MTEKNKYGIRLPNSDEQEMLKEHSIRRPRADQRVTIKGRVYCARGKEGQGNPVSCSTEVCAIDNGMISVEGVGESLDRAIQSLRLALDNVAETNCKSHKPRLTRINGRTEKTTILRTCPVSVEPDNC